MINKILQKYNRIGLIILPQINGQLIYSEDIPLFRSHKSISYKIANVFKEFLRNLKLSFKCSNIITCLFTRLKDRMEKESMPDVIYSIPCKHCRLSKFIRKFKEQISSFTPYCSRRYYDSLSLRARRENNCHSNQRDIHNSNIRNILWFVEIEYECWFT